jgi:hypothetical protein
MRHLVLRTTVGPDPNHGVPHTEEPAMTTTTYYPSLTGAVAREHVNDLLREATASRTAAQMPEPTRHQTPRRRPLWWVHVIARRATPRNA